MTTPARAARAAAGLAVPALLLLALTGCTSGSDDSSDSSDTSSGSAAGGSAADSRAAASAPELAEDALGYAADTTATVAEGAPADVVPPAMSVISTGTVSLRSDDVGDLLLDVQEVVDTSRGQVTERTSATDDDGALRRSRLVVRVPASRFGDTMAALEGLGTLVSSDSTSEDVSTQVIDNGVRIEVQRASIDRIRALLAEATDLRQVVAIEGQLSSREADLNSLEQTQAFLRDQSSRSTITVSLERSPAASSARRDTDETGFLAGLASGWSALAAAAGALATVAGTLLPWVLVAAVLAVPGVPLTRRLRRRTTPPVPAP